MATCYLLLPSTWRCGALSQRADWGEAIAGFCCSSDSRPSHSAPAVLHCHHRLCRLAGHLPHGAEPAPALLGSPRRRTGASAMDNCRAQQPGSVASVGCKQNMLIAARRSFPPALIFSPAASPARISLCPYSGVSSGRNRLRNLWRPACHLLQQLRIPSHIPVGGEIFFRQLPDVRIQRASADLPRGHGDSPISLIRGNGRLQWPPPPGGFFLPSLRLPP